MKCNFQPNKGIEKFDILKVTCWEYSPNTNKRMEALADNMVTLVMQIFQKPNG